MPHWATPYVGWQYRRGAQGPAEWDCWSFFREVQRRQYGRNVPLLPTPPSWREIVQAFPAWSSEYGWKAAARPCEGSAVFMARLRDPTHVGVWIEDLRACLHCCEGGSVLHDANHLAAAGWRVRGYYSPEA